MMNNKANKKAPNTNNPRPNEVIKPIITAKTGQYKFNSKITKNNLVNC